MQLEFICPHCGQSTLVDAQWVGKSGECRLCGRNITIEFPSDKSPLLMKVDTSRPAPPRSSSGLLWKSAVVLAILFGVFVILMLPLISNAKMAARRMTSANNLKQIGLAMHNYHDTYKQLPRAFWLTENGERRLSWRVALQPFMEHSPFFDLYQSNEAWDSAANMELASYIPPMFRGPWIHDVASLETNYLVITGPGTLFEDGQNIGFKDCLDGLSNTIMTVEVKKSGIHWTEPRDLDIRTMLMQINASDSNGISAPWDGGAQVGMADGSVKFLPKDLLESTLRAMITRAGREAVQIPEAR